MGKTEFDAFIDAQQKKPSIDWETQKKDWLESLEKLYEQVRLYLKDYCDSGRMELESRSVQLSEEDIGVYDAPQMVIKIGGNHATLTPVGTMLLGAWGRVDMSGVAGEERLLRVGKGTTTIRVKVSIRVDRQKQPPQEEGPQEETTKPGELVWKLATHPPDVRFIDLDEEAFLSALMRVMNA